MKTRGVVERVSFRSKDRRMSWLRPLGSATNPKSVEFQITNPQRDFEVSSIIGTMTVHHFRG